MMDDFQHRSSPVFRTKDTQELFLALQRHLLYKKDVHPDKIADFVIQQLWRPYRMGSVLNPNKKHELVQAIEVISKNLNPALDVDDLYAFCEAAIDIAHQCIEEIRHLGSALKDKRCRREGLIDNKAQLIAASVYAEYARADSDDQVVTRAVKRALSERRREYQQSLYLKVEAKDPLRQMFDFPQEGKGIRFNKGDIRHILMNKRNPISSLLREASAFSLDVLRPALGEEFSKICRPIGFADARKTRLLIEVSSSAMAQKLHFQKYDLLERLRKVKGLERILDFRFQIKGQQ